MNGQPHPSPLRPQQMSNPSLANQTYSSSTSYISHQHSGSSSNLHAGQYEYDPRPQFTQKPIQYSSTNQSGSYGEQLRLAQLEAMQRDQFKRKETQDRISFSHNIVKSPSLSPPPQEVRSGVYQISPDKQNRAFVHDAGQIRDLRSTSGKKGSEVHIRELESFQSKAHSINSTEE